MTIQPGLQVAAIGTVAQNFLHAWEAFVQGGQDSRCSNTVMLIGGADGDLERPAFRIHSQMTLASTDQLATINSLGLIFFVSTISRFGCR